MQPQKLKIFLCKKQLLKFTQCRRFCEYKVNGTRGWGVSECKFSQNNTGHRPCYVFQCNSIISQIAFV